MSLVTFWLGDQEYAFEVTDVVEMTASPLVTRVPGAPARFAGVTNWRGRTIPVLNLRARLKLPDRPPDVKKRILVLDRPGPFGVLVERPGRILAASATHPYGATMTKPDDPIRLVRAEDGLVRILDPIRLFADPAGAPADRAPGSVGPAA
jgi:chemotaxis signal transduction protein